MIKITENVWLDERDLQYTTIRASGPGGQNVNKVSTAVQLRYALSGATSLPDDVRYRLMRLAQNRITAEGVLVIEAHRYRTQSQNREDALNRLISLLKQASQAPKKRRPTRPSTRSKRRRLEAKHARSRIKQLRRRIRSLDE